MAEETKTEDVVNEDTNAAGSTEASEATNTESEQASATVESSEAEQKLQEQIGELQGKFDTLSQDSSRNQKYLEEIWPYVDMDAYKEGRQGGGASDEEAEGSFLTQKEAKALEARIDSKIKTADFQRDFRTKYPDVGDKGPKEEMVRFFFENKTLRTDSFDKRLESAVKATRELLSVDSDKAVAEAKVKDDKTTAEAKAKAEAAAKASGLDSGSITSPQTAEKDETETTLSDYTAMRKEKQEKLKTL